MPENKTKPTQQSVSDFLNTQVDNPQKRADSFKLIEIISKLTGFDAVMWGPSIIGFGSYHYKYASGREGDAPLAGFSPRKDSLALYFSSRFPEREALLAKFGKHKSAKACIYVKKLDDIDLDVFKELTLASIREVKRTYPD